MREDARGNCSTFEGFCIKTSPVTPSFCFNMILLLRGNIRKKIKILRKAVFTAWKLSLFQIYKNSAPYNFFKIIVHFPFQMPKAVTKKKTGGHRVIFLIISASS